MNQDDRMSVAGGGRDPRGGTGSLRRRLGLWMSNGRNEGPPDLDELWRDFNRKLSRLFGGGRGGNDGNGPSGNGGGNTPPDMRGAGIGVALVIGVVLLGWLASGVFIVQEGQRGVITSFGKYSRTVDAGIQYRLPYPFQAHEVVSFTQLQTVEIGRNSVGQATGLRDSSMLTQDENIIDVRFTVQYRLKDARDYLFENFNTDEAVSQASESAVREIVGRSNTDAVLYEQRDAIANDLVKSIQTQLDRLKTGIEVVNVNLSSVQPPEQVQAAFDDAFRATADRERLKNEGEAYANDVIPRAQGQAARLREDAEAYRARVVSFADGDAQRFKSVLAEYQKAPAVTRDRLYIDTMQQVYSRVTKVMVEAKSGSNLLYLPLDKLMQQTSGTVTTTAPTPVLPTETTPTGPSSLSADPRSRDAMRSRDRDGR
ncbi:FtsH protease activity modulator HflK [Mitsuaria sp. CC2]|jgi:modulator of FtsH protease HflK|uniref:FtsH protease activity modulator HflK n=1 Tax=Mitsuaria sp. CC2 TaxID=3029186 RepID=UPI003B8DC0C0